MAIERARMSSVGLKAFKRIAEAWALTDEQAQSLLGGWSPLHEAADPTQATEVDDATLERLSLVIGIYAALHVLVGDHDRMRAWLRAPNAAALFHGNTALAHMVKGDLEDLRAVRSYLDWHAYVGW